MHAAELVSEAEASAAAIRAVRDELTGPLVETRRPLERLPEPPTGDTASRVDPATRAQPAVRPDTADDTGSQPVTPGRR